MLAMTEEEKRRLEELLGDDNDAMLNEEYGRDVNDDESALSSLSADQKVAEGEESAHEATEKSKLHDLLHASDQAWGQNVILLLNLFVFLKELILIF
jgi:hypothetical protein